MIIDSTYFEENNFIANINEPDPNNRTSDTLSMLIEVTERNLLSNTFGFEMYQDLIKYYKDDSLTPPTEYKNLVDGCIYEVEGKKRFWSGLRNQATKESLIADLVYYEYQINNITQTTGIGEVSIDIKVGNKANVLPKTTRAWNRFIAKYNGVIGVSISGYTLERNPYWLISNRRGNGYGVDYYGHNNEGEVSLIQFLEDNKKDYPLIVLDNCRYGGEFKNEWGI